jgi:mono/diheme cytochrome c family protein
MRAASILSVVSLLAALGLLAQPGAAQSAKSSSARAEIARGKYLVEFGGCIDCHTPGYFFGKPDMPRALGGSEVGFEIPGLGVFYGPNLTPDKADGRQLVPIMPWKAFAKLTKADANAIAAYLQSLAPLSNKVPGPFGASEKPTSFVMKVVPPPEK